MANIDRIVVAAIEKANSLGSSYADCRYVEIEDESLSYSDGSPESVNRSTDKGFGIRVIADGAWGFFGSSIISESEVLRAAQKAVEIARASARLNDAPVQLAPVNSYTGSYKSNFKVDPFTISLPEKIDYLENLDRLMAKNDQINSRISYVDFRKMTSFSKSCVQS